MLKSGPGDAQYHTLPLYTSVVRLKSFGKGDAVQKNKNKLPHLLILSPDSLQVFTTSDAGDLDETLMERAASSGIVATKVGGPLSRFVHKLQPEDASDVAPTSEDLDEGQVFRLGVALNQITEVKILKEDRIKVWYHPNRASKKSGVNMLVRQTVDKLRDATHTHSSPHTPTSSAHHFTVVTGDPAEAEALKEEVERAQRALAHAVVWLGDGLPLRLDSSIPMISVGGKFTRDKGGHAWVLPNPQWRKEVELPAEVSSALGEGLATAAAGDGGNGEQKIAVQVHLSTPLGLAAAEIPLQALAQSSIEGGAPVATAVRLSTPLGAESSLRPSKRWTVKLQWRAMKGEKVAAEVSAGAAIKQVDSITPAVLAWFAVFFGFFAMLFNGVFAHLSRLLNAKLSRLPHVATIRLQQQQQYKWKLILLDLEIQESVQRLTRAVHIFRRTLSLSTTLASAMPETADGGHENAEQSTESGLPHHIELLVEQHKEILTPDISLRFITSLSSGTKAFAALSTMVEWKTANGLAGLVFHPQPAFAAMKKHYRHGFPGWSKIKDCLVEVEAFGEWSKAYTAIAAEGVSEQAMLEHLLFTYEYAFTQLDARPLPYGKTVKIVDLDGLGMSDMRTAGFKFIASIGGVLSSNYPERLHKCFLVNAPGWWSIAWKVISPLIPPTERERMHLYSKKDKEEARQAMLEWIDEGVLPAKYGGKNALPREEWPMEIELEKYVAGCNASGN